MEASPIRLEAIPLDWRPSLLGLETIAARVEAMALRLEAIALRVEAIPIRLEAMALRLELGWR